MNSFPVSVCLYLSLSHEGWGCKSNKFFLFLCLSISLSVSWKSNKYQVGIWSTSVVQGRHPWRLKRWCCINNNCSHPALTWSCMFLHRTLTVEKLQYTCFIYTKEKSNASVTPSFMSTQRTFIGSGWELKPMMHRPSELAQEWVESTTAACRGRCIEEREREEPMQDLESTPGALKNGFASAGFFLREQEGLG